MFFSDDYELVLITDMWESNVSLLVRDNLPVTYISQNIYIYIYECKTCSFGIV